MTEEVVCCLMDVVDGMDGADNDLKLVKIPLQSKEKLQACIKKAGFGSLGLLFLRGMSALYDLAIIRLCSLRGRSSIPVRRF
jgi:hypothetical protein